MKQQVRRAGVIGLGTMRDLGIVLDYEKKRFFPLPASGA